MWDTDPKSTTADQAYLPLLAAAAAFDGPWSVSELRLSDSDIHWLKQWFSCLESDDPSLYCADEKFGALLLCLGAELCRESSTEDSVWPTIRTILPQSRSFLSQFFLSNGQPSQSTKWIITNAARSLNVRNAFDIEGTQQWFTTVKLQFGFTSRGAKSRLAEWLVGLGQPAVVQYLNGEVGFTQLKSRSFGAMWTALRQLRQERISEIEARQTLMKSPWVKEHWIDDLLKEAQAKVDILGRDTWTGAELGSRETKTTQEVFCPIEAVSLDWKPGSVPRLMFDLDCAAIESRLSATDTSELNFFIDGQYLCRWVRQKDGSWNGRAKIAAEPDSRVSQPNLSPKALTVRSRSDEPVIEWDFADSDLCTDVVVFDLDLSRIVDFGVERLAGNRHYAILCDRDCIIQGCAPTQEFARDTVSRRAVRLPVPLGTSLAVVYQDFVLWQPIKSEQDRRERFSVTLRTPSSQVFPLNAQTKMTVEGIPDDAKDVMLLIHKKTYDLMRGEESEWKTTKTVTLTPDFASKQRRVRVKFSRDGQSYTVEPRLSLSLKGAAMIRRKQSAETETVVMEPLRKDDIINTSEGTKWLRIWAPGEHKHPSVFEADYKVGVLRNSRISLRDIPGYGGELSVFDEGKEHPLGIWCQEMGCVRGGEPAILGSSATLFLLTEKNPSDPGYVVYEWAITPNRRAIFRGLLSEAIRRASSHRWKVDCSADLMALAVSYKGSWLGAWWSIKRIKQYIESAGELRLNDWAALKWLHVPILAPELGVALREAIQRGPLPFLDAWLNQSRAPEGLSPAEDSFDTLLIPRHFLWNQFPVRYSDEAIKKISICSQQFDEEVCRRHLGSLIEVSPLLLWGGIEQCRKRCQSKYDGLLRLFRNLQVDLPKDASDKKVSLRFSALLDRASEAARVEKERVREACIHRIQSLQPSGRPLSDLDRADLSRLGAALSGRKFLAAHIAQHFLG